MAAYFRLKATLFDRPGELEAHLMNQQRSVFNQRLLTSKNDIDGNYLLHIAGAFSAALYVVIGQLNRSEAGIDIWLFLILMTLLALVTAVLYRAMTGVSFDQAKPQGRWSVTLPSIGVIVFWAVVFRVIGVSYDPIMEDDYYRYLWDGYLFVREGTSYGIAPSVFFGDSSVPESFQLILDGINYPDTPTIYGPLLQYSFSLSYLIFPGQVMGLQLFFSAVDVLLILVLSRMSSRPALLLFAWCPLLIKETAFTAHPDVLGVLLLMGSLLSLQRQHLGLATFLLALSLCTKVFAILLAPLILWHCRLRHWLLFAVTIMAVYAPFWLQTTSDVEGLSAFVNDWQFNSSIHALLSYWSIQGGYAPWLLKAIIALLFCGFYALYAWRYLMNGRYLVNGSQRAEYTVPRGDWIFGVFFLLAPVVNAWYLVWLLAFATLYPSRWAWTASVAILLSYVTGGALDTASLDLYQQPLWGRLLEYGVILIALMMDLRARKEKASFYSDKAMTSHAMITPCVSVADTSTLSRK